MSPAYPIANICNLPADFRAGNRSALQLVHESGIESDPGSFSARAIASALLNDPSAVESWLRWSEDKRVSSGWYFLHEEAGYIVGFCPDGERLLFQDPIAACSEFIFKEVGGMLHTLRANNSFKPKPLCGSA